MTDHLPETQNMDHSITDANKEEYFLSYVISNNHARVPAFAL